MLASSNVQSVKYPGLEVTLLTSISPDSIATTRDINGRRFGELCVHNRAIPITRFTSSLLNSDKLESTNSTSRLFS
uniref:Leucine-rich repeat family protein n=1 Tax=Rhizophora mucronata TaxID=61149 RepID=A0A2P2MWN3_RHIMU